MRKDTDIRPKMTERAWRLKEAVLNARPGICTERALIRTRYFRDRKNRKKPVALQMAEAQAEVLKHKTIAIHDHELIVGNYTSKRVGGTIYPELHGIVVMMDLFKFNKRATSPLEISGKEIRQLLKIVPFWLFRFMGIRAHKGWLDTARFIIDQLKGRYYLINESGGIAHLSPDYELLVEIGADGIIAQAKKYQEEYEPGSDQWNFLESVKIAADALARYGERYADLALIMAESDEEPGHKPELLEIADICRKVPRRGASSFHEALQSIFFAQIAINLESLDQGITPGRMDVYLYPYYKQDLRKGILTREKAKELITAFCIKLAEIIPVFSKNITNFHGGMFNGQVITVGGVDEEGNDASNELSHIILEIMDELRLRQPNFHARVHEKAPRAYMDKMMKTLTNGSNSPALYNDDVMVKTLAKKGYSLEDARNYTALGCVEPVSQGKSFSSTDAALFNMPIMLELALNQGKRFGSVFRHGVKTKPVEQMGSISDVKEAFEAQLAHEFQRLMKNLQVIEEANRRFHPTPMTSMLLDGCLETGTCSTAGGARYNFSGIQCVAPVDTGDSLYAIEKAVFIDKKISLPGLVQLLKKDIGDEKMCKYLRNLPKFGNDLEEVDRYTVYVTDAFLAVLEPYRSTRGGVYTAGLYSVTTHQYYGTVTGALPNGRRKGETFASGIAPANGMDRNGPTALLNSVNRIDFTEFANGVNFNLKMDAAHIKGEGGRQILQSLLKTYFRRGGMQAQLNVIDPSVLIEARDNPGAYPFLLVRVSGYSAYFNDLTPKMKDELIRRSCLT